MAEIQVTVPESTFTVTTPASGFSVTTPAEQVISIGNPASTIDITSNPLDITVLTSGTVTFENSLTNTDELNEGITNLYFTNARARASISVQDSGGDGSLSYNSSTGVITYTGPSATEVQSHFSGGTGVTITSGQISIGQDVATSAAVQFSSVNIDNLVVMDSATLTTTTTTADQIVDSWSISTYRSVKYQIQIVSGSSYQTTEIAVLHDGTTATYTQYAELKTGSNLASFTVDISAGSVRLLTTPTNSATTYTAVRTAIKA